MLEASKMLEARFLFPVEESDWITVEESDWISPIVI